MKKKKLSKINLRKHKIANLKSNRHLIGGNGRESEAICPVGDDPGSGGGGGGGSMTLNWMCNPTASVCGPTQVTCACG